MYQHILLYARRVTWSAFSPQTIDEVGLHR